MSDPIKIIAEVLFLISLSKYILYFVDFFYLSRRPHLPECYRYTTISVTSNLYMMFSRLSLVLLVSYFSNWGYSLATKNSFKLIPEAWPSLIQVLIAFLAADFFYYLWHRISHEFYPFWVVHSAHHQDTNFNCLTGIRFSGIESFSIAFLMIFPLLSGIDSKLFFSVLTVNVAMMTWIHSSIGKLPNWFEYIFNTPSHHRRHHAFGVRSGNCNYGSILIIWDRLFNTFKPETKMISSFGVSGVSLGIKPMSQQVHGIFGMFKKFHSQNETSPLFLNPFLFFAVNCVVFSFFIPLAFGKHNSLNEAIVLILILCLIEFYGRAQSTMRKIIWLTWVVSATWAMFSSYDLISKISIRQLLGNSAAFIGPLFLIILYFENKRKLSIKESVNPLGIGSLHGIQNETKAS